MVAFQAMNDDECALSEFSLNACAYYVSRSPFTDFSPGVLLFLRNSHQQYKMTRSPFFSPLSLSLFFSTSLFLLRLSPFLYSNSFALVTGNRSECRGTRSNVRSFLRFATGLHIFIHISPRDQSS